MNQETFNFFFSLSQNHFVATTAVFLSYPLTYSIVAILIVGSLFTHRKIFNFSLFTLTSILSIVCVGILKYIFHTPRPFVDHSIIPLVYEYSYGFPSGHTALFAGLAVALYFLNKKLGIILGVLALLVGISRVVIGVHYPIDIIGGAIVGGLAGYTIVKIFKKI